MLKGKKTYIVAVLLIVQGGIAVALGELTLATFFASPEWTQILSGLGLASLRNGVK